ncbi:polysaccharide deacetylase family protein [Ekhidna sp. MALMAid0563]|uniref:polysaccharide deacetylase family protein n=1 Tax=Ekhidna sp. MALMAid0563 TaxID=3143937 RepID=UPI0032E027BE
MSPEEYIKHVLFELFLGIDLHDFTFSKEKSNVILSRGGKRLTLNNTFLSNPDLFEFDKKNLPHTPLKKIDVREHAIFSNLDCEKLPIIYGTDSFAIDDNGIALDVDIFGSCFFMLTRYEELVSKERDHHDRFPARASLAFKEGFLERPIVDEYVEVLWSCMKFLWPELERKTNEFRQYVSCDIDWLYDVRNKWPNVLKRLGGDIVKRKSITALATSLKHFFLGTNAYYDPFDFMIRTSNSMSNQLAFYLIALDQKEKINGDYNITDTIIKDLLLKFEKNNCEIGLHLSYNTFKDLEQARRELNTLREVLKEAKVSDTISGGRQHYLRWSNPETPVIWNKLGMKYDSTLGYADHIGFRAGTGREYPFYDLLSCRLLSVLIRPLLVMEVSMIEYMMLSPNEMIQRSVAIKNRCKQLNANFTLLWHNNFLDLPDRKRIFRKILES